MALFVVVLGGILLVVHSFGFILWWFLYCIFLREGHSALS